MSLKTPEKIRTYQRKLYTKAKEEPAFRFYQLYDKVWREDILKHGYALCREKNGAAGVDGESFSDIEAQGLAEWLAGLQEEVRSKTYQPQAVRQVEIPKPGGGTRPLGIPTVRDRVVQQAAKLIQEPIFEADLTEDAYGYRPRRSARDAIEAVHEALCEGYTEVVDADLSKYFETIPHHELMQSVARRVSDRWMLKLIKSWLKVPIEVRDKNGRRRYEGGKKSKRGTPQGGVISPLLANIYLNRYLKAWQARTKRAPTQAKLVAYADDFVILSRGQAREALAWSTKVIGKIGLKLNMEKTVVREARRESFEFLGYTFGPERHRRDGHWYLSAKPSRRSVQRLKGKLRQVLGPRNVERWTEVAARNNRLLRGWANYFGYGTRYMAYRAIDNYVMRRIQGFLQRRHKVKGRGTRRWPDHVIFGKLGVIRLRTLHVGPPPCASV